MLEEQKPTSPDALTINFDFLVLIMISAAQGILGAACGSAGMFIFGVLETGTLIFLTKEDHPDFIGDSAYQRRLMGDTAIGYICSKDRPTQNPDLYWVAGEYHGIRVWYRKEVK